MMNGSMSRKFFCQWHKDMEKKKRRSGRKRGKMLQQFNNTLEAIGMEEEWSRNGVGIEEREKKKKVI